METVANYFSLYWIELILGFLTSYFCFGYFHYKNEVTELNDALNQACDLLDFKDQSLIKKESQILKVTTDYCTERGIVDMQLKTIDELKEKYSRLEESKISDITQAMKNIFDYARGDVDNEKIMRLGAENKKLIQKLEGHELINESLMDKIKVLEEANDALHKEIEDLKNKGEKIGQ